MKKVHLLALLADQSTHFQRFVEILLVTFSLFWYEVVILAS